jgi:hypothetical protein
MDHNQLTSIGRKSHYDLDAAVDELAAHEADFTAHAADAAAHHAPVTLAAGSDAALTLSGQELTLADVLTPAEHTAIGDSAPHHARYTDAEAQAAVLTGIPEAVIDATLTANLAAGEAVFWLGTEHYYERGHSAIVSVLVDGVDKTADPTVWSEGEQRMPFVLDSPVGIACLSGKEPLVNRTMENNVWWIRRLVATTAQTWTVTVRERKILLNPLHITGVRCYPAPPALDTIDFRHSGGHSDAGTTLSNITHYLISGCPAGYEIEIWRWKTRSRYKNRPRRGRRWRPYLRCAPDANGNYILRAKPKHGILGICLYNPTTAARSTIRMFGSNSSSGYGGLLERVIRIFA